MNDDVLRWKEYVPRNLVRLPPSAFELARQAEMASILADLVRNYQLNSTSRRRKGLGDDMEMTSYEASVEAHKATARKNEAGERLSLAWDASAPRYQANPEYDARLDEYREAKRLESEAWQYARRLEREELL